MPPFYKRKSKEFNVFGVATLKKQNKRVAVVVREQIFAFQAQRVDLMPRSSHHAHRSGDNNFVLPLFMLILSIHPSIINARDGSSIFDAFYLI